MLGLIGLSLAIPVFLWMRPHWRDLVILETTADKLAGGNFEARVQLPYLSGIRRVGEAFNHMADNIAALLTSKKALTNAVAHELRTPLARLRYRLALLDLDENQKEVQAMERDLTAIDTLIEELLLHAKLDRPEAPLKLSAFDAVAWASERIEEQIPLAEQLIWIAPQTKAVIFKADQYLVTRALDNFLSNARRHTKSTIKTSVGIENKHYILTVEDDGPGIPEKDRSKVFDPFVRLDESRGRKTGGHGLGLAIVAGIAKAHHGQVSVESSELGGAKFVLRWPF